MESRKQLTPETSVANIGLSIRTTFYEALGEKSEFPNDQLAALVQYVEQISSSADPTIPDVNQDLLAEEVQDVAIPIAERQALSKLNHHQHMLIPGKVLVSSDEGQPPTWELIDRADQPRYEEGFSAVEAEIKEAVSELIADHDIPVNELLSEAVLEIRKMLDVLGRMLPSPEVDTWRRYRFIGRKFRRLYFDSELAIAESEGSRKIDRKVWAITSSIQSLVEDPEKALAAKFVEIKSNDINTRVVNEIVDPAVATRNASIWNSKLPKLSRPEIDKTTQEVPKVVIETAKEDPITPVLTTEYDASSVSERTVTFPVAKPELPWLGQDLRYVTLRVLSNGNNQIVIMDAIPDSLRHASEDSRKKFPLTKDDKNIFDEMHDIVARGILVGQLPHQKDAQFKTIGDKSADYVDDAIYTPAQIKRHKGSGPRIYFAFRQNLKGILPTHMLRSEGLTGDEQVILVIAETDKAHQIDVFKQLTVRNMRTLRAQNVGWT